MQLPAYAQDFLKPARFKVMWGGRGSTKSYTTARLLLLRGLKEKRFILCGREFQNSIADSVHKLLSEQIIAMGLEDKYIVKEKYISAANGTRFIFRGLHGNVESIKSIPGLTDMWLEEAQTISQRSWELLEPTIRESGSEIWVTFNPKDEDDPTYVKFLGKHPPDNSIIREVNWRENPWFSDVLYEQMMHMKKTNYDLYLHVWEGQCRKNSDAQIFKDKFIVESFDIDPRWDGPYFGADWGFSKDPTTIVKIYVDVAKHELIIAQDAGGVGVEFDDIPILFDKLTDVRSTLIRADNCRPETISYVSRKGFLIQAAEKWPGSVEDGVEWIRSFNKVRIHTRCMGTANEFRKYSFKEDRLTGDILTKIVDDHNHYIDAIRYGCEPMITKGRQGLLGAIL